MTAKARIKAALRGGALTVKDIAEEAGMTEATARVTLNRHKGDAFVQVGTGKEPTWALLSTQEEV
jgi:predicted transcriptional regulator